MHDPPRSGVWQRIRAEVHAVGWWVVAAASVAAFVLGVVGFARACAAAPHAGICTPGPTWQDRAYLSLQLFIWQSGGLLVGHGHWTLEIARLLAPVAFGVAALQAFATIFGDRVSAVRARFRRNHVIVCGLGAEGLALARDLRATGWKVVMLEIDEQHRAQPVAHAYGSVLAGDATDPTTLIRAGVRTARHLIAMCGDDAVNAQVIARASAEVAGGRRVLTCHAHVANPELWERLRPRELASSSAGTSRHQFFNVVDASARAAVAAWLPRLDDPAPHVVMVGATPVAERAVAHAALAWRHMAAPVRLRVTWLAPGAAERVEALHARWPRLPESCEVAAADTAMTAPDGLQRIVAACVELGPVSATCVCGDDDAATLALGLGLIHASPADTAPVVVCTLRERGLDLLAGGTPDRRLTIVGSLDRGCTADVVLGGTHEVLARAIHDEYVRTQADAGHSVASNPSMQPWASLPEALRDSNRRQADDLSRKVDRVGGDIVPHSEWDTPVFEFTDAEVETLARLEHSRWMAERLNEKWTPVDGPKDIVAKTSPYLREWDLLPEPVQDIDRTTVRRIPKFLARVGLGIRRRALSRTATPPAAS